MLRAPFSDEPEEAKPLAPAAGVVPRRARWRPAAPFGAECVELDDLDTGSSSSSTSVDDRPGAAPLEAASLCSVRALSWEVLQSTSASVALRVEQTTAPAPKKRAYNNSRRAAKANAKRGSRRTRRTFKENGQDAERVRNLLNKGACECRPMVKNCYTQFKAGALILFLKTYWSWPKWERQGMVRWLAQIIIPLGRGGLRKHGRCVCGTGCVLDGRGLGMSWQ